MTGWDIQYLQSIRNFKSLNRVKSELTYILSDDFGISFGLSYTCLIIIIMGNCQNPILPKSQQYDLSVQEKKSTQSSIIRMSQIHLVEEVESYTKLPDFSQKLSLQLNMGFVSILNQSEILFHLPSYLITSYHALVYVPQSYFSQGTSFTFLNFYFYPQAGSRIIEYPINQMFILANIIDDRVEIVKTVIKQKMVDKSSILIVRFQKRININKNVELLESQKISEAGEMCSLRNKSGQERVKVEVGSTEYIFWRKYRYCSNIFAKQSQNVQNGEMELQSSPNSKYISLRPLTKALTLVPGPLFSKLSNIKYSFIGFYSGISKQISQQKYFNIFTISSSLSSIIYQISHHGFIVQLNKNNKSTIQASINYFLSSKSSQYCKFYPEFTDYQHYKVSRNQIVCGKLDPTKDLQMHKKLISTNSLPFDRKFYLKLKLEKHCSDKNGLITIAFKQENQFKEFDDKQKFFENRIYMQIIKDNNTFETDLGVNDRSFAFQQTKQTNFTVNEGDYLTFYLDLKQKKLTCIIKGYEEDIIKESKQIRAFSFSLPEQLHGKNLQLYFETNRGGEKFRIC